MALVARPLGSRDTWVVALSRLLEAVAAERARSRVILKPAEQAVLMKRVGTRHVQRLVALGQRVKAYRAC